MDSKIPDNPANDQRKVIETALASAINGLSLENLRKVYIFAHTLKDIEERRPPSAVT